MSREIPLVCHARQTDRMRDAELRPEYPRTVIWPMSLERYGGPGERTSTFENMVFGSVRLGPRGPGIGPIF